MSHLTEREIAAALDPGGGGRAGTAARGHASTCAECSALLEEARRDEQRLSAWLTALDHPIPSVDIRDLMNRAAPRGKIRLHSSEREHNRVHVKRIGRASWLGVAATVVAVAVAAAAIVPASPVRQLVQRVITSVRHRQQDPAITPTRHDRSYAQLRGVAIIPSGPVNIVFHSAQQRGAVHIIFGEGSEFSLEADGDGPTYAVGQNAMSVNNRATDSVSYRIHIPAADETTTVRVTIAGKLRYVHTGRDTATGALSSPPEDVVLPFGINTRGYRPNK